MYSLTTKIIGIALAVILASGVGDAAFTITLENPVTTDLTGNPYSLSFFSTGVSGSTNPTLAVVAIPEASPPLILGLAATGWMLARRRKTKVPEAP